MRTITIYRSDFNGHKDSEGTEYFDYILSALSVPIYKRIDEIELQVSDFRIFIGDQEIKTQ